MSGKSQSTRARRERRKRVERLNKRLFNNPLSVFVEYKYPTIFGEYSELFRQMREAHPRRKNLLTSSTFRKWLDENSAPSTSTATSPSTSPAPSTLTVTSPDILTQAVKETGVEMEEPQQGPQDIRQQIDHILNEMLADEDLHDILQEPVIHEDEGIGLNLEDEIYHDIQPFDYELEVE